MPEPIVLIGRHCSPSQAGMVGLNHTEAEQLLTQLMPEWILDDKTKVIQKKFHFKNYHHTMAFVNALAWIAHREDHHPSLEVNYGNCVVRYSTQAIGGLSENDFICAAMIDALIL